MHDIVKYEQLYPKYFNNSDYVYGYNTEPESNNDIIVYKKCSDTITSENLSQNEFKIYERHIASHLEIVMIFNKFNPEKKSIFFSDNRIKYDVHFYITSIVPFYLGLIGNDYTGKYFEWHDCGALKLSGHLKDGVKEGTFKYYDVSETLQAVGPIVNNLRDGKWTIYGGSGIITECNYKGNILNGDVNVWSSEEKKTQLDKPFKTFTISDGKKNGLYVEYFDEKSKTTNLFDSHITNVKTKGNYTNDKKSGQWLEWFDNNYYIKSNYRNGIQKGFWSKYHSDGTLSEKMYIM